MSESTNVTAPVATAAAAPVTTPDTPSTAQTPPPATSPDAQRFAALSRKHKQIRAEAEQLKALKAQLAQKETKIKEWEDIKDPIAALRAKGFSYEEATQYVLNNGQPTPELQIKGVQEELAKFRQEQAEAEKVRAEQAVKLAQAQVEETITTFKSQVNEFVTSHPEDYQLIGIHESQELIYSTVEENFNRTGRIMSMKEAADLVENYLEERIEASLKAKRLSAKYGPRVEQPPASNPMAAAAQMLNQTTRTLSNTATAAASPANSAPRTYQEAYERALAKLKG